MKIKVKDLKNYTPFTYPAYMNHGEEIEKPQDAVYEVGDVVLIQEDDEQPELGVILGCIGNGEVRTDLCGMVTEDKIRPATIQDFDPNSKCFHYMLYADCVMEKTVQKDWKTGKEIIE